ncbi:MAG: group III truncated hemoglobin [Methylomonas sp.]|jgi:hemoglobin
MQDTMVTEQHIAELVRRFYERAANDEQLKAIFDTAIHDWERHHRIVENFWSRTLLHTDRYHGSPYPMHARLPLRIEQFEVWLTHFRQTANEVLPPAAAAIAIGRAEHMAESFKIGMFLDYYPAKATSCPQP